MKRNLKFILGLMLLFVFSLQITAFAAPNTNKRKIDERKQPARFARIAILPVVNLQEDIDYANTIVFQKALEVFRYPDYEIYDSDKFYKALEEVNYYELAKGKVDKNTEAMLRTIMDKSGLDAIVFVKLNRLTQEKMQFSQEDMDMLILDMNFMVIYNWREKIIDSQVVERKSAPYAAVMKDDWKLREYDNMVSRQLSRIAEIGKK